VFRNFEKDGEFVGFRGQTTQALTGTYNLYRASQLLFPQEKILEDVKKFSYKYLMEKQANNELLDKWIISKDLPGEIRYALDVPWYASLPRLEARYYLEQYGGDDDVWIGKTLYRMLYVNNNTYLEMAKLDYNHCQSIHRLEWRSFEKWYGTLDLKESMNRSVLSSYYMAAASIFEVERCNERVAWAKTIVLLDAITSFFTKPLLPNIEIQAFVDEFISPSCHHGREGKPRHALVNALLETLNQISSDALVAHGVDIHPHLKSIWTAWLWGCQKGANEAQGEAELIVRTINMTSGRWLPDQESLEHPQYQKLSYIINTLCHEISHKGSHNMSLEIESKMQELVQIVLSNSPNDLEPELKQTFLSVAKTYYYRAFYDPETINRHISKVLFTNVT
ncbi:hypothetical protein M8C21_017703, partial [Ambrosia artemisiifolia]